MNTALSMPVSQSPVANPITDALARVRRTFETGKTRPIAWRLHQLREIARMMREHEADFAEALKLDLGKCRFEAVLTEMSFVEEEAKYAIKRLWENRDLRVRMGLNARHWVEQNATLRHWVDNIAEAIQASCGRHMSVSLKPQ